MSDLQKLLSERKPRRPPSRLNGEFITNTQIGFWAERCIEEAINARKEIKAVHYGHAEGSIMTKEEFKEYYDRLEESIQKVGKRPDLLVLKSEDWEKLGQPSDLSSKSDNDSMQVAQEALAGLEVRSSFWKALKYEQVSKKSLSFTVKKEDLAILNKWREVMGTEVFYTQVFLDVAYIISFSRIIEILQGKACKFKETKGKTPYKITYFIPVSCGEKLGVIVEPPQFCYQVWETENGQLILYAIPQGGKLVLEEDVISEILSLKSR